MASVYGDTFDAYSNAQLASRYTMVLFAGTTAMVTGRYGGQALSVQSTAAGNVIIGILPGVSLGTPGGFTPGILAGSFFIQNATPGVTLLDVYDYNFVQQGQILTDSSGHIQYKTGSTTYTSTLTVPQNTWFTVEARIDFQTGATGSVHIRVATVDFINLTGVITGQTANGMAVWGYEAFGNGPVIYDDFYILDTTTTVNNNFLGEQQATLNIATGDGTVQWEEFPPSGLNYQKINSVPATDATYVLNNTPGQTDAYTQGGLTLPGVSFVQVSARISSDLTNGFVRFINPGVGNGSANAFGTTPNAGLGPNFFYTFSMFSKNPLTGNAWIVGDFTTLQIVLQCGNEA